MRLALDNFFEGEKYENINNMCSRFFFDTFFL